MYIPNLKSISFTRVTFYRDKKRDPTFTKNGVAFGKLKVIGNG